MTSNVLTVASPKSGWVDATCRRLLAARLNEFVGGSLTIHDAVGAMRVGHGAPDIEVVVHNQRFYRRITRGGTLGAGESYVDGDWDCADLVGLVRLLVRNRAATDALERGVARIAGWAARLAHVLLRDNDHRGSRRNIAAHYDLGNGLFERMLDSRMQYSAAMFEAGDDLEAASRRKLDTIVAKLELTADDHLLEIGSGWGGLAIHAARESGCRVTTTTVSREQYEYARARVAAAGLGDRVHVLCDDYRQLTGRFSKIVSVEMVEAVGANHLDEYFRAIDALLDDDGLALLQAITIEDSRYQQALRSVDFIKQHVFPGSFIPCVTALLSAAARASNMVTVNLEDLGADYAQTLEAWRHRFETRWSDIAPLGYDERFHRLWRFYLCYCEGGFRERALSDVQILLAKPGYRGRPWRVRTP
jgi:cyclopropane-fatty-acyl-phospholipid synthase